MANLLILADDFTGAMDTVVQFAKLGIQTKVGLDAATLIASDLDAEVLMVNTETRHLSAEAAYEKVYREARIGKEAGIPFLYKKTDSALRGNVGAELSAALAAWEADYLPFVPAYPLMGRTTKRGIHFIDGVPLAQSEFANDLFTPVNNSDVVSILSAQSAVPVIREGEPRPHKPYVEVFDAQTDYDLLTIASAMRDQYKATVMAGCAGIAAMLPAVLGLASGTPLTVRGSGKLLVLCGSMHLVAKEQVRNAVRAGFHHVSLSPAVKLGMAEAAAERQALIGHIAALCRKDVPVIVDANDTGEETMEYAKEHGISAAQMRNDVANSIGSIGVDLVKAGVDRSIFITGGDTLMGFLAAAGNCALNPVMEILPGVVRALLDIGGKTIDVITKAGSFGDNKLFVSVAEQMKSERSVVQ